MDPRIELLADIPSNLAAVDVTPDGAWVGVGGSPKARSVWFGGHVTSPGLECAYPLVCALDRETAVVVDSRTRGGANAWVVSADGAVTAAFSVGDAVENLASVRGRLVVTHFDEGFGNDLHGMLVFDRSGTLLLHYGRDVPDACAIVDCYAVCHGGGDSILVLAYPDFPLAEVDVSRRTQQVWAVPEAVHGASAISALGPVVFFRGSYTDRTAIHAWRRGATEAVRIASYEAPLRGLTAGWFLTQVDGQFARVRFDVSDDAV